MNKVLYPKLLNGSRYAQRMIGKEDILKTFKPEAIKRFYKDWYRPDLMAVMVVGDVEPKQAEKLIQQHFGKLKNPAKPRPRLYAEVPQRSRDGSAGHHGQGSARRPSSSATPSVPRRSPSPLPTTAAR
jgi:zinc protease